MWRDEYPYFIHPLSDGVPRQSSELLQAACELIFTKVNWENIDLILGIEAMGLPLATALCLASGKPLVVGRKRSYGLPSEHTINQSTGYSKGEIFLNDISMGDRVLVIDDVVSTGGTLRPILNGLEEIGAQVSECWVIFNKDNGLDSLENDFSIPLNSLLDIAIINGKTEVMNKYRKE